MTELKFALLGFGNVGRAFARLVMEKEAELRERYALEWRVVGIATGSHGAAIDPQGIPLNRALELVERGASLEPLSKTPSPPSGPEFVRETGADVMFENTPVDYAQGQPALDHMRAALKAGMHAITANKGPVVHGYRELTRLAQEVGRSFFFESAVMDGAPVFSMWREALPGANLQSFRGVLNSTTNLILTEMESGRSYAQALEYAQSIGIAETDPSGDTQGWDAAIKVAALVTVLMDQDLQPDSVERRGIEDIHLDQVQASLERGRRWKLICRADRTREGIRASVAPMEISAEDALYNVMGTSSAVTFRSDVLGDLTLTETDPGPETTAYGLLADLLNAVRERTSAHNNR
jgi:homoserine dehydrogenase